MLDIVNIPSNTENTKIFYATDTGSWQTWQKPRNAKAIQIFCLGSGAAGATGLTTGLGAKGGGSGGYTRCIIPTFLLPDTLYVQVAIGGGPGAATTGAPGNNGAISYVAMAPTSSANAVLVASSATAAVGGSGQNNNGTGATVATTASAVFLTLSIFTAVAGVAGSAGGGQGAVGTSQAALGSNITTGGAGGGGRVGATSAAGGSITPASVILTSQVNGGVKASVVNTTAPPGDFGYYSLSPFCATGGAGGAAGTGSTAAALAGKGGDGAYGCGGGGGGSSSGFGGATVGLGGKGGDGLVIITTIF